MDSSSHIHFPDRHKYSGQSRVIRGRREGGADGRQGGRQEGRDGGRHGGQ